MGNGLIRSCPLVSVPDSLDLVDQCTNPETGECSNPVIASLLQTDDFNTKLEAYRSATQAGMSKLTAALYWGNYCPVARQVSIRRMCC